MNDAISMEELAGSNEALDDIEIKEEHLDYSSNYDILEDDELDDEFVEESGSRFTDVNSQIRIIKGCGFSSTRQIIDAPIREYECPECPFKTNSRGNLRSHSINHKNSESLENFRCEYCSFETKWKTSLSHHMLRHKDTNEITTYQCYNCSYWSKYKKHLRRHMQIHSKGILYSCRTCNLRTKRRSHFENHKCKINEEENTFKLVTPRPKIARSMPASARIPQQLKTCWWYRCDDCSYETTKSDRMKQHVLKHVNKDEVTLQSCSFCSFTSKYKDSLRHHVRSRHKK